MLYNTYLDFINSPDAGYWDSPMTKQIDAYSYGINEKIEQLVGKEAAEAVSDLSDSHERETVGFINGYRYAMQIAAECGMMGKGGRA